MKKIPLILAICLLLGLCTGCEIGLPFATSAGTSAPTVSTESAQEATTAPTEVTTAPTEATTEATTEPVAAGPQPMDLVGTWQRTHTEVEGDKNKNTKATITVSGDTPDALIITYKDKEFSGSNFKEKKLIVENGELYSDCGNDRWVARVDIGGKYSYWLTVSEDGTLIMQVGFEVDGMPMVSTQWFARSQ